MKVPIRIARRLQGITISLLTAAAVAGVPSLPSAASRTWHVDANTLEFPRPEGLEPDIAFWKAIFTEYSQSERVIHDADHLQVIYEVIDTSSDRTQSDRSRRIQAAIRRYQEILESLAVKDAAERTREETRVAKLFEGIDGARYSRAAFAVRSQPGLKEQFREGLIRSGRWQQAMIEIFEGYGLPPQIAFLPHVESSFNPVAHSKAAAVGIWQFTRGTGRQYLRIGHDLDERHDVLTATHAAARHLRDNHRRLNTWPLALTAYNHGAAGLERAVEELGTRDIETIARTYRSRTFGFASRNFYVEFLAALDIACHPEEFFGPIPFDPPVEETVLVLPQYFNLDALSRALRVSPSELSTMNPALGRSFWRGSRPLPKGYALRIPKAIVPDPWFALASVPDDSRWDEAPLPPTYRVQRGDTLSSISSRFGVTVGDLKGANDMKGDRIYAGQTLHLPDGASNVR